MANFLTRIWSAEAVRYLLVGVSSVLLDIGLLWLMNDILHWPTPIAASIAFLIGFVYSFTLQRTFAFGSDLPYGSSLARYIILLTFNTVVTAIIVTVLQPTPMGWFGGKLIATTSTTLWNFFLYKNWVFAHTSKRSDAQPET